jgi:hypothetical protein
VELVQRREGAARVGAHLGRRRAPMAQGVRVTLAELLLAEGRCRVDRARGGAMEE